MSGVFKDIKIAAMHRTTRRHRVKMRRFLVIFFISKLPIKTEILEDSEDVISQKHVFS